MGNEHLFELINATAGLEPLRLALAVAVARWAIYLLPLGLVMAWLRGDAVARRELLQILLAIAIALAIAQVVALLWPQPRPFARHLGHQYLDHASDPGLPSDHVTALWSLALAALATHRFAVWCFPLLAIGLVVGWSRVFLGVHFPYDILAAFPVALAGAVASRALRAPLRSSMSGILTLYDRLARAVRACGSGTRKT